MVFYDSNAYQDVEQEDQRKTRMGKLLKGRKGSPRSVALKNDDAIPGTDGLSSSVL